MVEQGFGLIGRVLAATRRQRDSRVMLYAARTACMARRHQCV